MPSLNRLHPQARALVEQMAAHQASLPQPTYALTEAERVEADRQGYRGIIPLAGAPEPVHRIEERTVPGADGPIPVRLYRPAEGVLPLGAYFHGGSFISGDFDTHDGQLRTIAARSGCLIMAVSYRLAPEHPFPAAPEDCYAAVRWAAEHASELGVDPARLTVMGDSAGGTLAAVVALMARDRGGPPLAQQVLLCPNTDAAPDTPYHSWQEFDGLILSASSMAKNYDLYLPSGVDRRAAYVSPLRAGSLEGLPAALVLTAECDPLRDEGEAYVARLRAAGVPVEHKRYPGMVHGFYQLSGALDAGREALEQVSAALRPKTATA